MPDLFEEIFIWFQSHPAALNKHSEEAWLWLTETDRQLAKRFETADWWEELVSQIEASICGQLETRFVLEKLVRKE